MTNQLEKLIKKARLALEDEGSDSGAVSDYYENSGLSAVDADSGKFNDLDLPFDDIHLLNKENWKESKSNIDEDFLKDTFHGIDSSSSISQTNTSDSDSSDGVEDPLCLLEINQDSYDSFCQKSLWHSLMDIDSDSKLARNQKKNITDKPIKVAELEKSFFTMNSDEFVKPCKSLIDTSNKNDSHTKPHWKSLLHSRSGDEYEIWVQCKHDYVVTMDSDQKPKLSVPTNCSVSKTTKTETETDRMDTNLTSKEGIAVSIGRKYSNNIADKLRSCSSSHHQQEVKQIEKDQQIQSPLALHSQNMWSSFFKAQTKTLKNQQRKNKHKNFHSHEMQDSEFNHFEVGQYLLRGMINRSLASFQIIMYFYF